MGATATRNKEVRVQEHLKTLREIKHFQEQGARDAQSRLVNETKPSAPTATPNDLRFGELIAQGLQRGEASEIMHQRELYGPGLQIGRYIRASAAAHARKDYTPEGAIRIVRDVYRDPILAAMMEAEMSRALAADVPSEGGALIPETFSEEFIELLYPNTVVFSLGARSVPMPTGNLTMASLVSGSTAQYVSENSDTNATQPQFGQKTWQAKKLITIVPVSNDLLRSASPRADQIVRDDAVKMQSVKIDYTALVSPGENNDPRGIKYTNGTTPVTCGAITGDSPTAFFQALIKVYVSMKSARLGWCFNQDVWATLFNLKTTTGQYIFREELNMGRLLGKPYEISQQIPTVAGVTTIFFGDWAELLIPQQGQLEVAVSDSAAYLDAGGTMRASFSRDQTVVRLIDRHDIGLRLAKAMSVATDAQP